MINDFKKNIEFLADQIRQDNRLELLSFEFKPPLSSFKIAEKQEEYALQFSEEVRQFYDICGGVKLKWKLKNAAEINTDIKGSVEGSVNILDIDTMIMGYDGRHWLNELWSERMSDNDKAFKKRLKIFDYFGSDNVDAVCLEVKDGVLMPQLWVNNLDYGAFPLNLDLEEYLQSLCSAKGIWGWQFFFTDNTWVNSNHGIRSTAEHILKVFPLLFGHEPILKEFENLYEKKMKY